MQTIACIMSLASCSSCRNRLLKEACFHSCSFTKPATGRGGSVGVVVLASVEPRFGIRSSWVEEAVVWFAFEVLAGGLLVVRDAFMDFRRETARARQSTFAAAAVGGACQ